MGHHGEKPINSELLKFFQEQQQGTAARQYPDGRIHGDDEGAIALKIGSDPEKQLVFIEFAKLTTWSAFTPQQAIELAQSLIKHARAVSKQPVTVTL